MVPGPLKLVCGRTVEEFGASSQAPGSSYGATGFGGFPAVFWTGYSLLCLDLHFRVRKLTLRHCTVEVPNLTFML